MWLKMKNRPQKYDINRPKARHGHKYTKDKMCISLMMVIYIKQHVSNIWSSIHEKVKNTEAELKKACNPVSLWCILFLLACYLWNI